MRHYREISPQNPSFGPRGAGQGITLRADFFYRLNTVILRIAPLRKRPRDVGLLIEHFLKDDKFGHSVVRSVSPKAIEVLKSYSWPGNVRELQNTVERFKILVESEVITENDIPFNVKNPDSESEADYFDDSSTLLLAQVEKTPYFKSTFSL